jgi:hypothetical protein
MKKNIISLCFLCLGFAVTAANPDPAMRKVVDGALDFSLRQSMLMYQSIKDSTGLLPRTAEKGKLITCNSRWWTSGFYPGTLWYLYEYSRDPEVRLAAEEMTRRVAPERFQTDNHDVGFQINCSFGNGYRLTGRQEYRDALITAGNSLSQRFSPEVGCTRSWNNRKWQFTVIIDNMMNLELLGVSSSLTGDRAHYDMARSHADRTMENHFRPDGSSYHVVSYDSLSGRVLNQVTHQGVNDASAWSRGQAWGLYGFVMMYRQTGESKYLDHAVKVGEFIMNHPRLPKDKIPYWDFDAPEIPKALRDASAGAIMASAFVELSTYVDGERGEKFLRLAEKQIASLASPAYRSKLGGNNNFIVGHCLGFMAKQYEIDAPLAYADYYFVEALMRYRRLVENRAVVSTRTLFSEHADRAFWLSNVDRIARPLLENLAAGTLKKNMPVESNNRDLSTRVKVTHLEGVGRLIEGIAPWLELGPDRTPEGRLRAEFIDIAVRGIANGVDPASPDRLNFNDGRQPLVDAAFLAHGLLRAPVQLWGNLDEASRARLLDELRSSRVIEPSQTNWLFFSAMVECALKEFGGEWDYDRVKYALDRHAEWYKGDGWYGDGAEFHLDYYNSFVIQPMMVQVLETVAKHAPAADNYAALRELQRQRYTRYAAQQERLISPEGAYPPVGRSLAYRFGAFQTLSDAALRGMLPAEVSAAQARSALSAVMRRQIAAPGTFNEYGWLRVGFAGHQPSIGETYISTGSVYLCAAAFVALGLPAADEFWSAPAAPWTSVKAWGGVDLPCDKALKQPF